MDKINSWDDLSDEFKVSKEYKSCLASNLYPAFFQWINKKYPDGISFQRNTPLYEGMAVGWISVEDALPKYGEWVICARGDLIWVYSMFQYMDGKWWPYGEPEPETRLITHWFKPIPPLDKQSDEFKARPEFKK